MLRICSTTQTVVQVCDSLESATGVRFFSRSDCCFQKLAVWQLFREHVPQCTHNEPWLVWSYRMSLLMYRKTPWNNHASVITIILIYLRWQTEWFYSGSIDTHVDSSTKENVSNPAISRRHYCIEKPWNWKSLRTNLGSYAEGALQNRHSACLSRYIKFYGKII